MWGRFLLYNSGSKQVPIWLIVEARFVPAVYFVPLV
jgi:hypothetical protein